MSSTDSTNVNRMSFLISTLAKYVRFWLFLSSGHPLIDNRNDNVTSL